MKKHLQILTLFAAMLLSWTMWGQGNVLTVASGTTQNQYIPVYSYYMDNLMKTQCIYPDDSLTALRGMAITELKFYSAYNKSFTGTTVVSIGLTSASSLSSAWATDALQPVWTGNVNITNNEMVITLDNPFEYPTTGGNLLIQFSNSATGNCGTSSDKFYGVALSGMSRYATSQTGTAYSQSFLPKCTFTYEVVSCSAPSQLTVSNVTDISADISFSSTGTNWLLHVEPGIEGETDFDLNDTSYTLAGLNPLTSYSISVRNICGAGDSSFAIASSFRTDCGEMTIPYVETFTGLSAGTGSSHPCWTVLTVGSGSAPYLQDMDSYSGWTGPTNGNAYHINGTNVLATPYIPYALNTLSIQMMLGKEGPSSNTLVVGYLPTLTTPMDSMVTLATYDYSTYKTYMDEELDCSQFDINDGGYIVFKSTGSTAWYWWLDDVQIRLASDCKRPISFEVSDITNDGAQLTWTPNPVATNSDYIVEYGSAGFTLGTGTQENVYGDTSFTLTALDPSTSYDVYVMSSCSGETSSAIRASFRTACDPIDSLPYMDDFESYTASSSAPMDECWVTYRSGSSHYPYVSSTSPHSGSRCLYFSGSSNYYLALPMFSEALNTLQFTFWVKYSSSYPFAVGVMTNPNDLSTFDTVATGMTTTSWTRVDVPLGGYTGSGRYLAIRSNNYLYVDDLTVDYMPDCPAPTNFRVDSLDADYAEISWTENGSASSWTVEISDGTNTETVTAYSNERFGLSNLESNTLYSVTITPDCGDSLNLSASFRTPCTPVDSLPYTDDFESYTASSTAMMNPCWKTYTSGTYHYPYVSSSYSHSGSKSLYFSSSSNYYLALPAFDAPVNTLQLSFWLRYSSSYSYAVGVMSDPNNLSTFDTVYTGTTSEWHLVEVPFGGYTGTGRYIAIRTSNYMYIDDITVDLMPACPRPSNLVVDSIASDMVALSWTENGEATSWTVVYGVGNDSTSVTAYSNEAFEITELSANTGYWVKIYPDCSEPGAPFEGSFRTECGVLTLPYSDNFENDEVNVMVPCWTVLSEPSSYPVKVYGSTSSYSNFSPNFLYINGPATIATPKTPIALNEIEMSFDYTFENTNYVNTFYVGYLTNLSGSVTYVDTVTAAGNYVNHAIENYVVNFASTNVTEEAYIVISREGSNNYLLAIDNFVMNEIPECSRPEDLMIDSVSATTASFSWANYSGVSAYDIAYGVVDDPDASSTLVEEYISDIPYTLSGLNPSTTYYAWVRSNCGGEVSPWVSFGSFATSCTGVTTLPLIENFDGVAGATSTTVTVNNLPNCWSNIYTGTSTSYTGYPMVYNNSTYAHSGSQAVRFYCYSSTYGDQVLVLPGIDITAHPINSLQLSLMACASSSTYGGWAEVGVMTDPSDLSTFEPYDTLDCMNNTTYSAFEFDFSRYTGNGSYIAIRAKQSGSGYTNNVLYIDDVVVELLPDCPNVSDIAMVANDSNMLSITWTENGSATSWSVEYGPQGFTLGSGTTMTATTNSCVINGLSKNTYYDVYITPACTGVASARKGTFRTANSYLQLPFACDFEDTAQYSTWLLENASNVNKWCIGSAASHGTGSHSLYISNNNGASNDYTISTAVMDYAYVDVMLANPGDYEYSFDWRANGESTFDYIRVALVPVTEDLAGGSSVPSGFSSSALPAGWIALDGGEKLNLQTSWQSLSNVVTLPSAGVYHLVFAWRNDGSGGVTPPAAIDNIVFRASTCSRPTNVAAYNVTADSIYLSWDATTASNYEVTCNGVAYTTSDTNFVIGGLTANSDYEVSVRSICGSGDTSMAYVMQLHTPCTAVSLPYFENFDSITSSTTASTGVHVDCWSYEMTGSSTYQTATYQPQIYYSSSNAHSGSYSLRLYGQAYTCLPPVSASLDSLQLTFWDYSTSASYGLEVGVMEGNTFVPIETIPSLSSAHGQFTVYFSNYTGSSRIIAFRNYYTTSSTIYYSYHYIDDVEVDYAPTCMPVTDLHSTASTSSTVTLDWTDLGSPMAWEIAYDLTANPTANSTIVTSHPTTLTGLASTPYYFRVRPICSATDTGEWSADFLCQPGSWSMRANQTDTVSMCGGVIYDDGGINGDYSMNQNSYLVVMPDAPGHAVSLSGTAYIEGNSYDNLYIYDGIGTSGTALVSLAGSSFSGGTSVSATAENASGALTIYFKSDGSVVYSGFALDVSCVSNTCPKPTDLTATATSSSISLTWTDNTPGLGWDVEYGRAGFAHGMGTTTSTTVPSITISGLDATTTYDIYVRHICSTTDTGGWAKATVSTEMCDNPNIIEIGDSSATVSEEYYVPVNNYFHYTLSETILLSEELEAATFSAISFNYAYTSPTTAKTDVDIYIQPTTKTSFSSSSDVEPLDPNNAVLVYSGALNCQQGWNVFGFDTPYTYDGSSNLMVIVDDNSDDYDGSSYKFYASATTDQMSLSYYSDSYDPDVTSPSSFSGSKGVYSYRAQMQLISCEAGCSAPVIVSTQPSYNSITLNWNGSATDYEISYMSVNDADFNAPVTISGNSYTLGGLAPATQYSVRLRSICDSGMVSNWTSFSFTTDSLPCFAPEDLHQTAIAYTSVTLDWTNGGNEQNWVVKVFNSRIGEIIDTVSAHPATITGLTANEAYFATVQAACGSTLDGFSDWSDTISFTTSECVPVSNVACGTVNDVSVTVSWTAQGDEDAWVVEYGLPGFGQGEEIGRVVSTTNPYLLPLAGLDPNSDYEVYVYAQCTEGLNSIPAGPATFHTGSIGISGIEGNADINIYPNPTSGSTTISVSGISGKVTIDIVDMNGRTISSTTQQINDSTKVNVEGLAQGAYFVRIYGEEINSIRKLIVR